MEEVSDYFKSLLLNANSVKTIHLKTVADRAKDLNTTRKENRKNLMYSKRNINENITPIKTPGVTKQIPVESKPTEKPNKRLEMLKKWKEEKKRKEELAKKNAKPIFKVCHIESNIGLPNLENVNKQIKGKIVPLNKSFAPENHTFKPPAAMKPIVKAEPKPSKTNRITRSMSKNSANPILTSNKVIKPSTSSTVKKTVSTEKSNTVESRKTLRSQPLKNKEEEKKARTVKSVPNKKEAQTQRRQTKSQKNNEKEDKDKINNSSLTSNRKALEDLSLEVNNSHRIKLRTSTPKAEMNIEINTNDISEVQKEKPTDNKEQTGEKNDNNNDVFEIKTRKWSSQKITRRSERISMGNWLVEATTAENKPSPASNPKEKINQEAGSVKKRGRPRKSTVNINQPLPNTEEEKGVLKELSQNDLEKSTYKTPRRGRSKLKSSESSNKNNKSLINETVTENNENKDESIKTPIQNLEVAEKGSSSPVYISPFVTVSRGKHSARKEFKARQSLNFTKEKIDSPILKNISENISPAAGAIYFTEKLDKEIERIEEICEKWTEIKNENLPDGAADMIDVAIGQSKLLISKKFEQFRGLIKQCQDCNYEEKPITCQDLHGFWDMIYMQVEDLNKRFDNLERLKANNWEEILPENKKKVVKRGKKPAKAKATSGLREMIRNARNQKQKVDEKVFDGGYFTIKSPIRNNDIKSPPRSTRKSLRVSLLNSQTKMKMASPSLAILRVSQAIKSGDGVTPNKSILKTSSDKTPTPRRAKSVLFKDPLDTSDLMQFSSDV